jgi:uncharacterized protein YjdB
MLNTRKRRLFTRSVCIMMVMAMLFYPGFMLSSTPVSAASTTSIISTIKNVGTQGITSDSLGNVYYVKTSEGSKIYKLSTDGVESEFASLGSTTYQLVTDANDNIYAAANSGLKKIDPQGTITSISGPTNVTSMALAIDNAGNVYYSDVLTMLKKVDTSGNVTVLASGFNQNMGMAVDSNGNVYVADYTAHVIKKVDTSNNNNVTVIAGTPSSSGYTGNGGQASDAKLKGPHNMIISDGQLYFAEYDNYVVRKIDLATGIIDVVAGNGTSGNTGDGGAADAATLGRVFSLSKDAFGILYIAAENATKMVYTPGTLSGTVLDTNNNPVNGATVAIAGTTSSTTTDALGSFTLNNVTPGSKKLTVTATGYGNGEATAAIHDGQSVSVGNIVIGAQVSGVTLDKPTLSLEAGGAPVALAATVSPSNADNKSVTWHSSDVNIATVDNNGLVTPVAPGTATITVTTADGGKTATSAVTVTPFVAMPAIVYTDAAVQQITSNTATAGGNIASDGGAMVTERGIVYSKNANPTVVDGKAVAATGGTGAFSVSLAGLQSGTIYHSRAYAVNASGISYGQEVIFATLSSSSSLDTLQLSGITLDQTVSGSVYNYTANVPNSTSGFTVTATVSDPIYGSVSASVYNSANTLVAGPVSLVSGETSKGLPLEAGSNRMELFVIAQDGTSTKYTVTITRAAPNDGPGGGGPSVVLPVVSINGKLTLPVGQAGEVRLDNGLVITVPANASSKELGLTIEKVLDAKNLLSNREILASSIYEVLKNFPENFSKSVTLTFVFDPAQLKTGQTAAIFYYDEVKKVWVKVNGSKISGDRIAADVDHFTKFAVLAVDRATGLPVTDSSTEPIKEAQFSDISGHWAEANIKQAVSEGIVKGYTDGSFKPNSTVTRAEFTVMLMNALKAQDEGAELIFTDVASIGVWAKKAVEQAAKSGIVKGFDDNTFRPDAKITRAEMAEMIARAMGLSIEENAETGFADDKDIPAWVKGAVAALKKRNLIEGKGSNQFDSTAPATRAEALTIILKMLEQGNS